MIKTPRERGQALGGFLFCPFVPATSPISKDFQQHQEPDTLPILVLTDFSKEGQSKAGTDDEAGNQGGLGNKEAPRIWLAWNLQLLEQLQVNEMGRTPPCSSPWPVVMDTGT